MSAKDGAGHGEGAEVFGPVVAGHTVSGGLVQADAMYDGSLPEVVPTKARGGPGSVSGILASPPLDSVDGDAEVARVQRQRPFFDPAQFSV